jgi:GntR family transcriptional regulator
MYLQIIEQIRERVAVGDWARDAEIPSIRQLAVALRVSVITIKRAYFELEREGVIVTHHGKPSRVAEVPNLEKLRGEDLDQHLDRALHIGALLGLSPDELAERLERAAKRRNDEEQA